MITSTPIFRAEGFSCLAAPGTLFTLNLSSVLTSFGTLRFIPQHAYLHLRSLTGTIVTSPGVRIGTNVSHNDIAGQFIPAITVVLGQIGEMPLTSPLIAPPVTTSNIILEITQSAVGPSVMTADVLLTGILIG